MVITQQQFYKAMEEINDAFKRLNERVEQLEKELEDTKSSAQRNARRQRAAEKDAA